MKLGSITYRAKWLLVSAVVLSSVLGLARSIHADQIPSGWEALNMRPVGYSGLEGRGGAFKMAIKQVNGHWYLFLGHLWNRGWSIVDVTQPEDPKYLKFVPGPDNTWTIQVDFHDNLLLTGLQDFYVPWGFDPKKPVEEGILFWDISDPINWKPLSHWKTGVKPGCGWVGSNCPNPIPTGNTTGTHRNGYPGGKYAFAAAYQPGFKGLILVILDVSDPKNPKEAGKWWMPGQKDGEQLAPDTPPGTGFHGPAIIEGTRAYLGYGSKLVILDIADVASPKLIGQLSFGPPFVAGRTGVHDAFPIPGRDLLFVHSEGLGGDVIGQAKACEGPLDLAAMVDIHDPQKPRMISTFPLPIPPKDSPYKNFCDKPGRFGPHNISLEYHLPDVQKQADLIYLTYFNAGLRVFNIKDPRLPVETAWFIPPTPTKRMGPIPEGPLVTETEDVLADTRGYIYITDKQWGLWILRHTGKDAIPPQ